MTPTTKHRIATYGTLKEGYGNYNAIMPNCPLLGTTAISGVMQTNGWFPRLFDSKEVEVSPEFVKTYELQIFEVDERQFRTIENMEHGAGYRSVLIDTKLGPATVYISNPASFNPDGEIIDEFTE